MKPYLILILLLVLVVSNVQIASAAWTSDLNTKIISYYDWDDATGTSATDSLGRDNFEVHNSWNSSGLINGSYQFNGSSAENQAGTSFGNMHGANEEISLNFWVLKTGNWAGANPKTVVAHGNIDSNGDFDLYSDNSNANRLTFRIRDNVRVPIYKFTSSQDVTTNQWSMVTLVMNNTMARVYLNGTLINTTHLDNYVWSADLFDLFGSQGVAVYEINNGNFDELGIWNRTLTNVDVTQLWNSGAGITYDSSATTVTLSKPAEGYESIDDEVTFNCSGQAPGGLFNLTLIIDGVDNYTEKNLSSGQNLSLQRDVTLLDGSHNWTCEAYNSKGALGTTDTRNFTIVHYKENSQTYPATVLEASEQIFSINLSYRSDDYNSVSAKLNYNGTNYTGVQAGTGNTVLFNATIDIPTLATGADENRTFNWFLTFINATATVTINSTSYVQLITSITFEECNATATPFINFSTYEAVNPFPSINGTFKSAWRISVTGGSGEAILNRSYEDITGDNRSWAFCLAPNNRNYTVSADIEYDGAGYAKNFYYLINASYLGNSTTNVSLYLLNDSSATLTVLETVDGAQSAIQDVYMQIQMYDIGTDTFYTVSMAKTDHNGEDLVYLNWYDTLYKFILLRNNEVVEMTSPYKVSSTPQIFEIISETAYEFEKFEDFQWNLYYNDSTENFVLTFVKPSGDVDSGCLRVIKRNRTNDYLICETCETSSSATLYCNVGSWGNGTFIGTFYATGSTDFLDLLTKRRGIASEVYEKLGNLNATVLAIIFSGVVLSFFLITPALGVIGILVALVATYAMGFQPLDVGVFVGLIIVGGIVIWAVSK